MSDTDIVVNLTESYDDFFDAPHVRKTDPMVGTRNTSGPALPVGGWGTPKGATSSFEGLAAAEHFDPHAREMARLDRVHKTTSKISSVVAKTYGRYFEAVDQVEDFKARQGFLQKTAKKAVKEYKAFKNRQKQDSPW
jgi:hypothetical protein